MNILFLSQVLPYPLDAGPKVRSYYVLRYLAQQHSVTLVAFSRATDTPAALAHLESFCRAVHTIPLKRSRLQDARHLAVSFLRARPFLVVRDDLSEMYRMLREVVDESAFDVVHADQLSMAHYALTVPSMKRVLDQHNAVWTIIARLAENEASRAKKMVMLREARLMREYEEQACARFDQVVTVTEQDKNSLTFPLHPSRAPIRTIPICIDPDAIRPLPFDPKGRDLICIGGMFYPPNVDGMLWFASEVLPRIWRESPDTRFWVIGARPDPKLRALAQGEPRILVTGYVDNPTEYLSRGAAFVVPLRAGGGMRVKILDAWARGVPIISTTIGAEGIALKKDDNILIADTPAEFAEAALHLIQDRAFGQRIAENGRRWVEVQYAWRTIYRMWDVIYDSASPASEQL